MEVLTIEVYHHDMQKAMDRIKEEPHTSFEDWPTLWPDDYHLAARVQAIASPTDPQALDHTFALTNTIDRPWTLNPGVECLTDKPRSTSVGDVLRLEDGSLYRCEVIGWKRLPAWPERGLPKAQEG